MVKAAVLKTAVAKATSGFESLALRSAPSDGSVGATTGEMAERLKAPVC